MRKSREQIRIEAKLKPVQDRRAAINHQMGMLKIEDAGLLGQEEMLLWCLGKDQAEGPAVWDTPVPPVVVTVKKPRRPRTSKQATSVTEAEGADVVPRRPRTSRLVESEDAPTHRCMSCLKDIIAVPSTDGPVCPICGSSRLSEIRRER